MDKIKTMLTPRKKGNATAMNKNSNDGMPRRVKVGAFDIGCHVIFC